MTATRTSFREAWNDPRTTGSVRFPQSAVEGRFSSSTAGDDRLRTDLDLDEVGGMRVPRRYVESTEMGGRIIFQAERVEVGVELAPDTFTLQPSTESDRKQ